MKIHLSLGQKSFIILTTDDVIMGTSRNAASVGVIENRCKKIVAVYSPGATVIKLFYDRKLRIFVIS
jgi:hypothetical protein